MSREVGLEIGLICARNLLKSNHLHYGYWPAGLEAHFSNLHAAQENYASLLLSHVPADARRVLDVGCGSGQLARTLTDAGHQVDCVSPSSFLNAQARLLLGDGARVFDGPYEQFETSSRYDLILFGESFQYVNPEQAIEKSLRLLAGPGYLLICDFFRKDVPGKSPIGGGHLLDRLYRTLGAHSLVILEDLDLTAEVAPTLDVADGLLRDVLHPTIHLGERLLRDRHPLATMMLKYLFRRRIGKIHAKYFTGSRTGEAFRKYKSYRLLLCRAAGTGSVQPPGPTPCERLPFDALQAEPRQAQTPFHLQILEDRS
jgi:SAM-dependent methyltransferase